ncbi:MAG: hypothetical protein IT558_01275 [Alphaproteobacteria bacterium]|nr:hypothetical protein [Alphaproteobacteria bacterium]
MRTYTLFFMAFLAGCAGTSDSYKMYLQKRGLTEAPTTKSFQHCHGYGCQVVSDIALTKKEWQSIERIFKPKARNAEKEREKIKKAIGLFEKLAGAKDGTSEDIAGTFRKTGRNQLDCVDESTNTTLYLSLLESQKLLRFHTLRPPMMRLPIINAGRWPHQTAVIVETKTGIPYAVDSWFHDNGTDAEIIDLKTWKEGWKPESVRDLL